MDGNPKDGELRQDSGASIAKFTAVVSFFKFICFSLGFVVKFLFSRYLPTSFTDAYFWAEESFFNLFTIGEDLLGSSYLPVFVHAKVGKGEETAWRYSFTVLLIQGFIALAVTGTVIIFIDQWTGALGSKLLHPELAKNLLIIFLVGLVMLTLASTLTQNLNAYKKFTLAAFSEFVNKIMSVVFLGGVIVFFYKLVKISPDDPDALSKFATWALYATAFGFCVGVFGKFIINVWGLRRPIRQYFSMSLKFNSPEMKTLGTMIIFLLVGSLVGKLRDFVELGFKQQETGVVSYISYAKMLKEVPMVIFPFALGVVLFPYLSEAVTRDDRKRLVQLTMNSMRLMFLLFAPIIVTFFIFGPEIVGVLFYNSKNFPLHAVQSSGIILAVYAIGFLSYVAEIIVLQTFFSYRDALTPTAVSVACAGVHVGFLFLFFDKLGYITFPAAYLMSRTLKAVILFYLLLPRFKGGLDGELHRWASFAVRAGIGVLLAFGAAILVSRYLPMLSEDSVSRSLCMKRAVLGGVAVTIISFAAFYLLRITELHDAASVASKGLQKVKKLIGR